MKFEKSQGWRYDCSLLRKHNWFRATPYGYTLTHKYFLIDTICHIYKWIKIGRYNYWKGVEHCGAGKIKNSLIDNRHNGIIDTPKT